MVSYQHETDAACVNQAYYCRRDIHLVLVQVLAEGCCGVLHFSHGMCHGYINLASNTVNDDPELAIKFDSFFGCHNVTGIGNSLSTSIAGFNAEVRVCLFNRRHESLY
jgi:hypothetical protein